jgi:hypothetical protein
MEDRSDGVRVTVTPAAHHWQASLRLVLQVREGEYFVLLSYANGSTAIHRAVDDVGTVSGDWWGTFHAPSLGDCLTRFAEEHGISRETLRTAIGSVAPATVAFDETPRASVHELKRATSSSVEHRDGERSR